MSGVSGYLGGSQFTQLYPQQCLEGLDSKKNDDKGQNPEKKDPCFQKKDPSLQQLFSADQFPLFFLKKCVELHGSEFLSSKEGLTELS